MEKTHNRQNNEHSLIEYKKHYVNDNNEVIKYIKNNIFNNRKKINIYLDKLDGFNISYIDIIYKYHDLDNIDDMYKEINSLQKEIHSETVILASYIFGNISVQVEEFFDPGEPIGIAGYLKNNKKYILGGRELINADIFIAIKFVEKEFSFEHSSSIFFDQYKLEFDQDEFWLKTDDIVYYNIKLPTL